jgi:Transposase DDE domain
MYFRKKTSGGRAYLQIVESRREGAQVRQQVIATLGRIEDLRDSGQLERLLRSGARFAAKAIVVNALAEGTAAANAARRIGPALVFERLWEETGCRAVIEDLSGSRKYGFPLERAVFLTVLHRLFAGGSDRAADRWREDYTIDGVEDIDLHHLYRAMAWLGEEQGEDQQDAATPFAPRCQKDVVEEELFARRRDLFSKLDLVFMDTTSLYFEGEGGQTLGQRGFSKDHRPDLNQMILAVLLDGDGRPVCTEMWPGNTADVGSLVPVVDRLRKRFSIQRICIVADRGMISAETIAELEARGLFYILGVRERSDKRVRELVLDDPAPFIPLTIAKRDKDIDYEAKAVALAGRRYIVCRNREEMKKDAAARATILAALERQLKKGDKSLVGNKGYRRFLATPDDDHFVIDRAKAEEDAKFDGIFVLRTNTDLSPLDAMLCYKRLWMVERAFRTSKNLFATRPIFHKLDETIRGHVSCSFLALLLKKELEDRIANLGLAGSWPDILADLDSLTETEVEQDGKRFLLRTPPRPAASLALRAAGVALPPTVRQLADL